MQLTHEVKRVGAGAWQAACQRLGTRRLVKLLLRGTNEDELRAVMAELLNREPMVVDFERGGTRWCAPTGDEIFTDLFCTGSYHADDVLRVDSWVAAHLDRAEREVVVDVGANIGTTTCPLARAGRRVVAVEPVPATVAVLQRNVDAQGLRGRVDVVNRAVSREPGVLAMTTTTGAGSSEVVLDGHGPAFEQWGMRATGTVAVEAAPLADIVAGLGIAADEIRFVWSDTQGFEADVILSGLPLWSAGVPLYLEVWPHALERRYTIDGFVDTAAGSFSAFAPSADLRRPDGRTRAIDELAAFIRTVDRWSDALLIP